MTLIELNEKVSNAIPTMTADFGTGTRTEKLKR